MFFFINDILFQRVPSISDSILFIHTAGLGDLVHSTKIINTLSKSQVKIFFLVKSAHLEFYKQYEGNVHIISVDYSKYQKNLLYRYSFLKKLQTNNFKYSFLLNQHRLITDDDIAIHCCAQNKVALNLHDPRYIKLGYRYIDSKYDQILFQNCEYVEIKYDSLLENYFPLIKSNDSSLYFNHTHEVKSLNAYLGNDIITCQPYSLSENRNWQKLSYIQLFEYLIKTSNSKILLFGEFSQREKIQELVIDESRIINLAGKLSLKEVNHLLLKSKYYIGIDSAISHLAEKCDIKRIIIVGGGSFGINYPKSAFTNNSENVKYLFNEMKCFGCNWICIQKLPYCINEVSPKQVIQNIELLNGK